MISILNMSFDSYCFQFYIKNTSEHLNSLISVYIFVLILQIILLIIIKI